MALAGLKDELLCSICQNIYTDPVTLRCGHNFCRDCIDRVLDTQDGSGVYSCPECRARFQDRPLLMRNISLHNVVQLLLSIHQPHQEEITGICCTYCIHSPAPAVKSCLLCEASLCDKHLRVHSKSADHILIEPTSSLEKKKCSVHKKILEYYCTEDAVCICVSCRLDGDHRGHRVEKLDEASEKKQELQNVQQELTTNREKTEEKVQNLEERSHTQDLPVSDTEYGGDDVIVRTGGVGEKVMATQSGGIYGQGPADILLDVNTAAPNLLISDDLKSATCNQRKHICLKTPKRFQYNQVMSSSSLSSGRHYWDVEISGSVSWMVGMCYPSIDRRGRQSHIGYNNKSWGLGGGWACNNLYSIRNGSKVIPLPDQISSDRVRICLDYEAGELSFYELCDPIRLLHTFTTTFTEPLYAVLYLYEGFIKILGWSSFEESSS